MPVGLWVDLHEISSMTSTMGRGSYTVSLGSFALPPVDYLSTNKDSETKQ